MTTDEKDVFIQIQNSIVSSKALVLVNCLNTFVHDCSLTGGNITGYYCTFWYGIHKATRWRARHGLMVVLFGVQLKIIELLILHHKFANFIHEESKSCPICSIISSFFGHSTQESHYCLLPIVFCQALFLVFLPFCPMLCVL